MRSWGTWDFGELGDLVWSEELGGKGCPLENSRYRYFSLIWTHSVFFIFDYHLKSTTKLISFRERTKNQKIMAFIISR